MIKVLLIGGYWKNVSTSGRWLYPHSSLSAFRRIIAHLNFAFWGWGFFFFFTSSTASEEEDTVSTTNPEATTPPPWVCSCSCSHAPLPWEFFLTDCDAEEHAVTSTGVYIKKEQRRVAFCALINH